MNKRKLLSFLRRPRLRHGGAAALITALFIAFCAVLNVTVSALEEKNGWWRDLSFNRYATTSAETEKALSALDRGVELILLYQSGNEDVQLHRVLSAYELLSPHIIVRLTDIARDPGVLARYQSAGETGVEADSVIVNCPETGRYKVLGYADFMTAGYNVETGEWALEGLAYEKNLTEAILAVARDSLPVTGVLQGHGELDTENLALLLDIIRAYGSETREVNLTAGDTLEGVDLLIIASPRKDLSDRETEAVAAFAKEGGSLFVTRDYTDTLDNMPNYLSLLKSYGVIPLEGVVIAGEEDAGSYYSEPVYLLPYMTELDLTRPLTAGGMDVLLMPAAAAFETPAEGDTSLSAAAVLKSGPHAYLRALDDGADTTEKQPGDREGELAVAVYARRMHVNGNISRLFAAGSSMMFTEEYIYQRTYCEEFVKTLLAELLPAGTEPLNIAAAPAARPAMRAGSQTLAAAMTAAPALLILLIGLAVLLPRRSR